MRSCAHNHMCRTVLSEVGVDDAPWEPKFDSRFADGDGWRGVATLFDNRERENGSVERACRGGREEGIRDKAAGTGHLSGSRSYLCTCPLTLCRSSREPFTRKLRFWFFVFFKIIFLLSLNLTQVLWSLTISGLVALFDAVFWCWICCCTGVGMVVYAKKSLYSLLSVFKKKGECWLMQGFDRL